jgi:hypothetical protein
MQIANNPYLSYYLIQHFFFLLTFIVKNEINWEEITHNNEKELNNNNIQPLLR